MDQNLGRDEVELIVDIVRVVEALRGGWFHFVDLFQPGSLKRPRAE
jgi:hypothetical protein